MGNIVHGNKNFGYADIVNNGGTFSFGTPHILKGMTRSSAELTQEQVKIPADDNPAYAVVNGAKVENLTSAFRYIDEAYVEYLGYKKETNGFLCDTGAYPNHCVFFEETIEDTTLGTKTTKLHYFYNVKGSKPSLETNTDSDSIEAREIEVNYVVQQSEFVEDSDGNLVQHCEIVRTSANANLYDEFKTRVLLPTDAIPSL